MWSAGSKPIRSNVTIPTTSFSRIFFSQMTSCAVHYDIIYHPFPINSQYLKTCGVNSPHFVFEKWEIFTAILKSVISNQDVVCSQSSQSNARQRSCFMEFSFSPFSSYLITCMALRRLRTLNYIHRLHISEWEILSKSRIWHRIEHPLRTCS